MKHRRGARDDAGCATGREGSAQLVRHWTRSTSGGPVDSPLDLTGRDGGAVRPDELRSDGDEQAARPFLCGSEAPRRRPEGFTAPFAGSGRHGDGPGPPGGRRRLVSGQPRRRRPVDCGDDGDDPSHADSDEADGERTQRRGPSGPSRVRPCACGCAWCGWCAGRRMGARPPGPGAGVGGCLVRCTAALRLQPRPGRTARGKSRARGSTGGMDGGLRHYLYRNPDLRPARPG